MSCRERFFVACDGMKRLWDRVRPEGAEEISRGQTSLRVRHPVAVPFGPGALAGRRDLMLFFREDVE